VTDLINVYNKLSINSGLIKADGDAGHRQTI